MRSASSPWGPPLLSEPPGAETWDPPAQAPAEKLSALVSLTKPRIVVLVLLTVAIGYLMGARGRWSATDLIVTLTGTGLVAAGASVWNQYLERARDALMRRTARRPLPSGRVSPTEAVVLGSALTVLGLALLLVGPHPIAAAVAATTFLLYVFVYTPLKPVTTLNTAVGAVPGALPPVIGWSAATGDLGIGAWSLFMILFLWQFPHFLAIAWIYRDDYARGGHRMLPHADPTGALTGRQATWYALALVPAALMPTIIGLSGSVYFVGALALGLFYLASAVTFWLDVSDATARGLLRASFLYLPAVLLLLLVNSMPA